MIQNEISSSEKQIIKESIVKDVVFNTYIVLKLLEATQNPQGCNYTHLLNKFNDEFITPYKPNKNISPILNLNTFTAFPEKKINHKSIIKEIVRTVSVIKERSPWLNNPFWCQLDKQQCKSAITNSPWAYEFFMFELLMFRYSIKNSHMGRCDLSFEKICNAMISYEVIANDKCNGTLKSKKTNAYYNLGQYILNLVYNVYPIKQFILMSESVADKDQRDRYIEFIQFGSMLYTEISVMELQMNENHKNNNLLDLIDISYFEDIVLASIYSILYTFPNVIY